MHVFSKVHVGDQHTGLVAAAFLGPCAHVFGVQLDEHRAVLRRLFVAAHKTTLIDCRILLGILEFGRHLEKGVRRWRGRRHGNLETKVEDADVSPHLPGIVCPPW